MEFDGLDGTERRTRSFYRCSPRYFERVLGERLGRNAVDSISINCAPVCNYACEKCLARAAQDAARDAARTRAARETALSENELREILSEARKCGARYVEIQGSGEPLAPANRGFVFDVVRAAHDYGLFSSVLTNGSLLDEATARFLAEHDADVLVSLDYLDARAYACRSGTGNEALLGRVLANVESLRRVYAPLAFERGDARVLRAGIHATLANDNAAQMPLLRRLAGEDLLLAIDGIADFGAARGSGLVAEDAGNFAEPEPLSGLSDESIILSSSSVAERGFEVCGAFYYGFSVDFDGTVVLDAHLLETRGLMARLDECGSSECGSGRRGFGVSEAARFSRRAARAFFEETGSRCFCPMRDRRNYERFLNWLARRNAG